MPNPSVIACPDAGMRRFPANCTTDALHHADFVPPG
jgi:hypothetical protein